MLKNIKDELRQKRVIKQATSCADNSFHPEMLLKYAAKDCGKVAGESGETHAGQEKIRSNNEIY